MPDPEARVLAPAGPATRAFTQYLLAMCLLFAALRGLELIRSGKSDPGGLEVLLVLTAALAVVGTVGAYWALLRPQQVRLAVWLAAPAVFSWWIGPFLMSWAFHPVEGGPEPMVVVNGLGVLAVALAWLAFALCSTRPINATLASEPRADEMPPLAPRGLAYRPPDADHSRIPVTRAGALFTLTNALFWLAMFTTSALTYGPPRLLPVELLDPRWIAQHGPHLLGDYVIPPLLSAAALATLLYRPRRRFLTAAVVLALAVGLAEHASDLFSGRSLPGEVALAAGYWLIEFNFAVFLLRALRHRW